MARRKFNFLKKDGSEFIPEKGKFYKRNNYTGEIEELSDPTEAEINSHMVLSGSKSDIRKLELIERNLTVLENKIERMSLSTGTKSVNGASVIYDFTAGSGETKFDVSTGETSHIQVFKNSRRLPTIDFIVNASDITLLEATEEGDDVTIIVTDIKSTATTADVINESGVIIVSDVDGMTTIPSESLGEPFVLTQEYGQPNWKQYQVIAKNFTSSSSLFVNEIQQQIEIARKDGSEILKVASGNKHTVMLYKDGTIKVVGDNTKGQLGIGADATNTQLWQDVIGVSGVADVDCGGDSTLLVLSDGTMLVAGDNSLGQLGTGNTTDVSVFTANSVTNAKSVSISSTHAMVLHKDGTVSSTGDNSKGQLGDGTLTSRNIFIKGSITGAKQVECGNYFSAYISSSYELYMTGSNTYGQLGVKDSLYSTKTWIKSVSGGVLKVSLGDGHSIIKTSSLECFCTGKNTTGQLGINNRINQDRWNKMFIQGVTDIATGDNYTIVLNGSTLLSTGINDRGQLGTGDTHTRDRLSFTAQLNVTKVFAGGNSTFATYGDNTIKSVGLNDKGQLGLNHMTSKSIFSLLPSDVQYTTYTTFKKVSTDTNELIFDINGSADSLTVALWV